jgi:hypothetical protein
MAFQKEAEFSTFKDFEDALQRFQDENHQLFVKESSVKV